MTLSLVDLGTAPPSNAYLTMAQLHRPEQWYPLRVLVCQTCWLAQTEDFAEADELFSDDYAYFSSFSSTWLAHSERYVEDVVSRLGLTASSHVVEIAANDGYLLQFVQARGIPCVGIEPTASTAAVAMSKGIRIIPEFFGTNLAMKMVADGEQADLLVANNVLAHVPAMTDFATGCATLLKDHGVATFEFQHLKQLVDNDEFDTIYHEHFSYLSLVAVEDIFAANGLAVFDVEQLSTHGGSLRVWAQRADTGTQQRQRRVDELRHDEIAAQMMSPAYYQRFQASAERVKDDFLSFLIEAKRAGLTVAAYGAAAKGNTLFNFAGVRPDLVRFVVDRSPSKQGKFLPGSRIPVTDESELHRVRPDYIVILPWNLRDEISRQLAYARQWNAQFVTAVPRLSVLP